MKRLSAPVLLLSLLAALLAGCSNDSQIIATGLKGELTGIVCASDGTVTAGWRVTNSNVVAYIFSRVRSKVYVNGTYVGMIVDENPLGIPASAVIDRPGKITGSDAAAGRAIAEAQAHGSASYRVDTQITIRLYGDATEESKLTSSGTVPVLTK